MTKFYFDEPYPAKKSGQIVIPLIIKEGKGTLSIPLVFPFNDLSSCNDIHVYYDDYENDFHIVIPNPVCPRWPMLFSSIRTYIKHD